MIDTTFGNVQANLTYKKMVELIEQLKAGDKVKLRDDLVEGTYYRLEGLSYKLKNIEYSFYCNSYNGKIVRNGEEYEIVKIDTHDKSICLRIDSERGLLWIPYNMVDIDWLFLKQVITQNKLEKEQLRYKTEEEDFYQQAQELNEIAHKELQEAVDKLNEAIAKVNAVNKIVGARDVDGYGVYMFSLRAIKLSAEDTHRFELELLK